MAGVNIGPRIGVEGESEYRKQMNQIIQSTKTLKTEMKATESGFSASDSAMKKAAERTKILSREIDNQKRHIENCRQALQQATDKYGEADSRTQRWAQALNNATAELNRMNSELANNNALTAWGQDVEALGQRVQGIGSTISSVGDAMTKYVTGPIVAGGAASVKLATSFEDSLAKVSTIADESEVSMTDMSDAIKNLSNQTGIGASDIAEATYQAISAGRSTADAVGFVEQSSKLAAAGFTDVTTSVDTLTTILNAYGLSAEETTAISDKLITTQNKGKTTVNQLGQSLGTVIPTAVSFGTSLDQVLAAYVSMTKSGIKTADATTYLNGMLNALGKSGTDASDILKEKTGKSFHQLMNEGWSLSDALKIVVDAAEESGLELADMFGNVRAGKAAMNLAKDGSAEFNAALVALGESAGATEIAFEKVNNTTSKKFTRALNRVKNSGIEAGEAILTEFAPAIEKALGAVTKATTAFSKLSDEEKKNIVKWAAVAAAIGPVVKVIGTVTDVTGKAITKIGELAIKLGSLGTAAGGSGSALNILGAAFGTSAGLATLALGPLVALSAAFISARKDIGGLTEEQSAFSSKCSEMASKAAEVKSAVDSLSTTITENGNAASTSGADLTYWKDELAKCYDESGHLKEGMESLAEYALNQLNEAMGTDYSTEFIANAENSAEAIKSINAEIDNCIAKLQQQAIATAFQSDYAEALKNQAESAKTATEAESTYTQAVENQKSAQAELQAAMTASDATTKEGIDRQAKATDAYNAACKAVKESAKAYKDSSEASAEASSQVTGLKSAMEQMAKAKTAEEIDAAAKAYANVGTKAEEAGKKAADSAQTIVDTNTKALDGLAEQSKKAVEGSAQAYTEAGKQAGTSYQSGYNNSMADWHASAPAPEIDQNAASVEALETRNTMQGVIGQAMQGAIDKVNGGDNAARVAWNGMQNETKKNQQGNINVVNGGNSAAQTAWANMNGITTRAMQGAISGINGATEAASAAHGAMQGYLNANPLSVVCNVVQNVARVVTETVQTITQHAEGGFTNKEQLSWLSEGNKPEVVIPLSVENRKRALDLYRRTGAILGAESPVYMPAPSSGMSSEDMYNAVKSGAADATTKIYLNNREITRAFKDMGVAFG